MKILKLLQTLLVTSIFILGALFPSIWILLFILVYINKDRETKKHNRKAFSRPKPIVDISLNPITESTYTPVDLAPSRSNLIFTDLNNYKDFKQDYLRTSQWNTLRKHILKRDNYTCQACSSRNIPLEVHHISYTNFMQEKDTDLIAVCRSCHQSIHDRLGYDYNTIFSINS